MNDNYDDGVVIDEDDLIDSDFDERFQNFIRDKKRLNELIEFINDDNVLNRCLNILVEQKEII